MNFLIRDIGDDMYGKFQQSFEMIINFILLNILWFLACVPLITIFPATAAMFGVVRQWKINKDNGVFSLFLKMFKDNFLQSVTIQILWMRIGLFLYLDFYFILLIDSMLVKVMLVSVLIFVALLVGLVSIYIFPIMVHYQTTIVTIIRTSLILAVRKLGNSLLALCTIAIVLFIVYEFPMAILVLISVAAYFIYFRCHQIFIEQG